MEPAVADLVTAIGLVLVIEGALYALFPEAMKRAVALLGQQTSLTMRASGLGAAALGVGIVWLVRH